jgi:hypothetical protein
MVMLETVTRMIQEMTYPVGSIYLNASDSTNPGTLLGFGTWEAFGAGRVMVGKNTSGTFATAGSAGGAETVTLTAAQSGLPAHSHNISTYPYSKVGGGYVTWYQGSTGTNFTGTTQDCSAANASSSHTNLQPYIVVYAWKRTA